MKRSKLLVAMIMLAFSIALGALSGGCALAGTSYVEASGEVNIHKSANPTAKILGTLAEGYTAEYADKSKLDERGVRWYRVYYMDGKGWISSMYSKLVGDDDDRDNNHGYNYTDDAVCWEEDWWLNEKLTDKYGYSGYDVDGTYVKATGDVFVRKSPSLTGKNLGTLKEDSKLFYANNSSIDDRDVRWYQVYYDGGTGWVSSMYSKLIN